MKQAIWVMWAVLVWGLGLAQGSLVGKVENSKAFIALTHSTDGKLMAYVCDSENLALWFVGKLEADGSFSLQAGKNALKGKIAGGEASGTLSLEAVSQSFKAVLVSGEAAFYRYVGDVNGERYVGGWIVDASGEQRGSVIGGGGLRASLISPKTLLSDHPSLSTVVAWLVTPDWVAQNLNF